MAAMLAGVEILHIHNSVTTYIWTFPYFNFGPADGFWYRKVQTCSTGSCTLATSIAHTIMLCHKVARHFTEFSSIHCGASHMLLSNHRPPNTILMALWGGSPVLSGTVSSYWSIVFRKLRKYIPHLCYLIMFSANYPEQPPHFRIIQQRFKNFASI